MEKQPVSPVAKAGPSECRAKKQVDTATTSSRKYYDITGPDRDVIIHDFINMSDEAEFENRTGPLSAVPQIASKLVLWMHTPLRTPYQQFSRVFQVERRSELSCVLKLNGHIEVRGSAA